MMKIIFLEPSLFIILFILDVVVALYFIRSSGLLKQKNVAMLINTIQ